jgi:hypothetical protein
MELPRRHATPLKGKPDNPKENGFKRFLNTDSKTGITFTSAGLAAYRRGGLGISPPANYDWLWVSDHFHFHCT